MKQSKPLIKIWNFFKKNYFVLVFFICIALVGVVFVSRLFLSEPTYVYAKIKVSQGYWWASTNRPAAWFINGIKKGDIEKGLTGQVEAQVLKVIYYPYRNTNQFDIYLDLKLKANKTDDKYYFNRSVLGVGSPIDLEFPNSQFSGTVINFSPQPLSEKYEDKIIYLTKRFAYPWEYDTIQINDKYFDGQQNVFEILAKSTSETNDITSLSAYESLLAQDEARKYVVVKALVRVKKIGEQLVFGEEQTLNVGETFGIVTKSFCSFDMGTGDYIVAKIE